MIPEKVIEKGNICFTGVCQRTELLYQDMILYNH